MPTLISTLGASDANSYVATIAEATALLDGQLIARTAWDAATDDDKIRGLITAARVLDTVLVWKGSPKTDTQAMVWPRYGYHALGGVKYGPGVTTVNFPTTWPPRLPLAQALLAAHLMERASGGQGVGQVDGNATIKRIEAGSVKLEYKDGATYVGGFSVPDEIFVLLQDWTESKRDGNEISQVRLVRG